MKFNGIVTNPFRFKVLKGSRSGNLLEIAVISEVTLRDLGFLGFDEKKRNARAEIKPPKITDVETSARSREFMELQVDIEIIRLLALLSSLINETNVAGNYEIVKSPPFQTRFRCIGPYKLSVMVRLNN